MTISPNGFWHLSLPHSWFLGGIQNIQNLPLNVRERGSFVGCIQKVSLYIELKKKKKWKNISDLHKIKGFYK